MGLILCLANVFADIRVRCHILSLMLETFIHFKYKYKNLALFHMTITKDSNYVISQMHYLLNAAVEILLIY